MTDLIDRADSGEIPPLPGETRTRIDLGENTMNLGEYVKTSPSFDAIPRRTIDITDTVVYHLPPTVAVMPDPETEHLTLLGTIAGVDGELRPAAPGPFPTPLPPPPPPAPQPSDYAGRHRLTWDGRVRRVLTRVGVVGAVVAAVYAGLVLAALVVMG